MDTLSGAQMAALRDLVSCGMGLAITENLSLSDRCAAAHLVSSRRNRTRSGRSRASRTGRGGCGKRAAASRSTSSRWTRAARGSNTVIDNCNYKLILSCDAAKAARRNSPAT